MGFIVGLVMKLGNSVGRIIKLWGQMKMTCAFLFFIFIVIVLFASGQNIVLFFALDTISHFRRSNVALPRRDGIKGCVY